MKNLFSTNAARSQDRYQDWRDFSDERFMPMVHTRTDRDVFDASAKGIEINGLSITRVSLSALMLEATSKTVRHPLNKPDVLGFSIKLAGDCVVSQYDRVMRQEAGDISIVDANDPFKFVHLEKTEHLIIQIPRDRIEKFLGPARNFAAISMKCTSSLLVKYFFRDFLKVHHKLSTDAANRMVSIGADLIVASIAERMAAETPKSLRGTVIVQKAKAFIEDNLGNSDLDPSYVAAATGVSLRYLQTLFDNRGQHIAEWIWLRRLDVAAERLGDANFVHLPIGNIAYACGFLNQAHFSRRFKDRFTVSPSDYRRLRHAPVER